MSWLGDDCANSRTIQRTECIYGPYAGRHTNQESDRKGIAMLFRTMNLSAYVAGAMRSAGQMRELGPYAVVALVVPGGCLIALLLWAFRNRAFLIGRARRQQSDPARAQRLDHGSGLDRIRSGLDRILRICEAAHSWYGPHVFAQPASAIVFLRAGSAARSHPQKRRRTPDSAYEHK